MVKTNFKQIAIALLCVVLLFSCSHSREATKEDNKNIKKILKDGNFLYSNYFSEDLITVSEANDDYIYRMKLRADEEYEYNYVEVKISKESVGEYYNIEYTLDLSQSKGKLNVSGDYITSADIEGYVDGDIIEKLVNNSNEFSSVVLNGEKIREDSVSMDIF